MVQERAHSPGGSHPPLSAQRTGWDKRWPRLGSWLPSLVQVALCPMGNPEARVRRTICAALAFCPDTTMPQAVWVDRYVGLGGSHLSQRACLFEQGNTFISGSGGAEVTAARRRLGLVSVSHVGRDGPLFLLLNGVGP